jgi:hypothetical protein
VTTRTEIVFPDDSNGTVAGCPIFRPADDPAAPAVAPADGALDAPPEPPAEVDPADSEGDGVPLERTAKGSDPPEPLSQEASSTPTNTIAPTNVMVVAGTVRWIRGFTRPP